LIELRADAAMVVHSVDDQPVDVNKAVIAFGKPSVVRTVVFGPFAKSNQKRDHLIGFGKHAKVDCLSMEHF